MEDLFIKFDRRKYNFKFFFTVILIEIIGIFMVNSADPSFTPKQIIGAVLGFFIVIFLSFVNYDKICEMFKYIFLLNAILLVAVLLFGKNVNEATRWIEIGFQFQPSEFSKVFMIIFMASFLERRMIVDKINSFRTISYFCIYLGIGIGLIFLEPDLSTSLCLTMVLCTMLYIAGLSYKIIIAVILALIPIIGGFLTYIQQPNHPPFKDYQVTRILSFVYPSKYSDSLSQTSNSIMAIGSGQLTGKGLTNSTLAKVKDANFISEQQTDFIFSVIGEEFGFIGSVVVIAIILIIVLQCINIARHAKDTKGMLIASGMGVLIMFQSFMNIGVATGLLPNTGIPLPFVSYGLSSLISLSIGIGMVMNISLQRQRFGPY